MLYSDLLWRVQFRIKIFYGVIFLNAYEIERLQRTTKAVSQHKFCLTILSSYLLIGPLE